MTSALHKVDQAIYKSHPGYSLTHKDVTFYYNHHLSTYTYTDSHLLIHVQAPFSRSDSLYTLYQARTIPVPLQAHDPSSTGYTKLTSVSDYIAISPDKSTYFELSQAQLSLCTGSTLLACPFDHILTHRPQYSCTAGIFFHQDNIFTNICAPKIFPNTPIPNNIIPTGQGLYLISTNTSNYQLTCTDQAIRTVPSFAYAHVSVPCGCTLTVHHMTVSPPLSSCNKHLEFLQTLQPFNYHIFLTFGFEPHTFPSDSLSNYSLALDIPDVNSYVSNFTDLSNTMQEEGLDLKRVVDAIAKARSTYNEPNIQIDPDLTFLPFVNDSSFLASFVLISSICTALLIIAVLILAYKTHKANTLLQAGYIAASTALPTAKASLLTKSTTPFTTPAITESPTVILHQQDHYASLIFAILIALALYKAISILYRTFLRTSPPNLHCYFILWPH